MSGSNGLTTETSYDDFSSSGEKKTAETQMNYVLLKKLI
jgi:hypothetical protein